MIHDALCKWNTESTQDTLSELPNETPWDDGCVVQAALKFNQFVYYPQKICECL